MSRHSSCVLLFALVAPSTFVTSFSPLEVSHPVSRGKTTARKGYRAPYFGPFPSPSCTPFYASPSPSPEDSVESNVLWLQKRFSLTDEWAQKTAARTKHILNLDRSVLNSRLDWLQERLKLKKDDLGKIVRRNPNIFTVRSENLEATLDFLSDRLDVGTEALSRIVQSHSQILGLGINENQSLQRNLEWFHSRLGLEGKKLANAIRKAPTLLVCSVDNNLEPTFLSLQEYLGFTDSQMKKALTTLPAILGFDFETNLKHKLIWLEERFVMDREGVARMVKKQPSLLTITSKLLDSHLIWIKERLGFDDAAVIKMGRRQPHILYFSPLKNLEPTILWFEENFRGKRARKMLRAQPALFGCSIQENMVPTFKFYKDAIGDSEAISLIQGDPACLTYSLTKRLEPRLKEAQELGIRVDVAEMRRIAKSTPAVWRKHLAELKDAY